MDDQVQLSLNDSLQAVCKADFTGDMLGGKPLTGGETYANTFYRKVTPYVQQFYPSFYQSYWREDSKIDKAFRLVQVLMDKKFVKEPKTVKDFITLVNALADEL